MEAKQQPQGQDPVKSENAEVTIGRRSSGGKDLDDVDMSSPDCRQDIVSMLTLDFICG